MSAADAGAVETGLRAGGVRAAVGRHHRRRPEVSHRLQRESPLDQRAGASHRAQYPGAGPRGGKGVYRGTSQLGVYTRPRGGRGVFN